MNWFLLGVKHAAIQLLAVSTSVVWDGLEAATTGGVDGLATLVFASDFRRAKALPLVPSKHPPFQHPYAVFARLPFTRIAAAARKLPSTLTDEVVSRFLAYALRPRNGRLYSRSLMRSPLPLLAIALLPIATTPSSTAGTSSDKAGCQEHRMQIKPKQTQTTSKKSTPAPKRAKAEASSRPAPVAPKRRSDYIETDEEEEALYYGPPPVKQRTSPVFQAVSPAVVKQTTTQEPSQSATPQYPTPSTSATSSTNIRRSSRLAAAQATKAPPKYANADDFEVDNDDSDYDVNEVAVTEDDDDHLDNASEATDPELEEHVHIDDSVPAPSTSKKRPGRPATSKLIQPRCHLCGIRPNSETDAEKHRQLTKHDEMKYALCDLPGCDQPYYRHNMNHQAAHFGDILVCGFKNEDGTTCQYTTPDPTFMKLHFRLPHKGPYHCKECNWFMKSINALSGHLQYHCRSDRLQHISTYVGPSAEIPIRGMEKNKCPQCSLEIVCLTHFIWHWNVKHSKHHYSKRNTLFHVRCDLCGLCMPISFAKKHLDIHCYCVIFPQIGRAIRRSDENEKGFKLSLCDCKESPLEPRKINDQLQWLARVSKKEDVEAVIESVKSDNLVKEFFEDNANADPESVTYAIIQVDPRREYTFFDFIRRILYIGSSINLREREYFVYKHLPGPDADSDEVQYRIRLGTTIDDKRVWQFNDAAVLETFVLLFLSTRNLWNQEYPRSVHSSLMDDRFVKFVPVFDAISTVVLLGAYEEIVAKRNWKDRRVAVFEGNLAVKVPTLGANQGVSVPSTHMSSQEAVTTILQAVELSGKSLEALFAGARARLITTADREVQTDEVLARPQADIERAASPDLTPDISSAPDAYEIEEDMAIPASPVHSAYETRPWRYPPVFEVTCLPSSPTNLTDVGISESNPRALSMMPPTPKGTTSAAATPTKTRALVERTAPGCCDIPPTKIGNPKAISTTAASATDDPQSAKSDDSGVDLAFDFSSANLNDAPRHSAANIRARFVAVYSTEEQFIIDLHGDPLTLPDDSSTSDSDSD